MDDPQAFDNDIAEVDREEKEIKCVPERGTCRPQCPTVEWNERRCMVEFSWTEDVEGCDHEPVSTIILLTPVDEEQLEFPESIIASQTALEVPMTKPAPNPLRFLPEELFAGIPDTKFEYYTYYYVSALYRKDMGSEFDKYGLPSTGFKPLYVFAE